MDNFAFMRDDFDLMFLLSATRWADTGYPHRMRALALIVPCSCCFSDILSVV